MKKGYQSKISKNSEIDELLLDLERIKRDQDDDKREGCWKRWFCCLKN